LMEVTIYPNVCQSWANKFLRQASYKAPFCGNCRFG
jgi:hypothetical protein